ncbi:hypothetical protein HK100_004440 [Physocladia obscura]|uniref:N-acetyltransferase domain-containing protein n=1 Tax=Physocladia obscura TaxID=109957 RepID=A0AAD5SVN3_9FUNG|nr:hypothetical protein HK100_004440 [Physocladia obscura]
MTSQLQFDISVCTVADAQGIGRVNMSAFWDDVNWQLVWATKTLDYVVQQNAKRLPHSLALASSRIHQRHLKVVDSATGIVVGYGRFILPEQLKNEWLDAQVPEPPAEDKDKLLELYNSADWSMTHVADDVDAPVTELKHKHFRTENIVLDRLAVLPEYQRRGIGKLLLSQVVEVADQFGVDISVLGKPKGTSLYSKHGFKILGTITQNLAQFGGTDNYTWSVLEYEAKKN